MQTILRLYPNREMLRDAFRSFPGEKDAPRLEVTSGGVRRLFRVVSTREDAHRLAGITLAGLEGTEYAGPGTLDYLRSLVRFPSKG